MENLGEPGSTVLNRLMSPVALMFNTTGVNRDELGRMSNTGAIPAHSGNVRGSTGSLP